MKNCLWLSLRKITYFLLGNWQRFFLWKTLIFTYFLYINIYGKGIENSHQFNGNSINSYLGIFPLSHCIFIYIIYVSYFYMIFAFTDTIASALLSFTKQVFLYIISFQGSFPVKRMWRYYNPSWRLFFGK